MIINFFKFVIEQRQELFNLLMQHIQLTTISVLIAILIGVPLGILVCYVKKIKKSILGFANIIQAIPSMALLGFAIPFLGIGKKPAIVMVILYSLLPIIKNTYTGINNINLQTLEAAKGIGLTKIQRLFKIQIPLALPVIMSGVRISAVTAVGLMTIAAFVGSGGLGYMVFSGIRTVNNNQILAGAIPACILALLVDYIFSIIEQIVTPISLQINIVNNKQSIKRQRREQKIVLTFCLLIIISIFLSQNFFGSKKEDKSITISSLMFTEQFILANMVSDLIEYNTDIKVDRKLGMGGTQILFKAIEKGDIDLYIEYTGTIYSSVLKYDPTNDVEYVYNVVKNDVKEKYNIEALKEFSFNNTYVLAVRDETSKKYGLETISDLRRVDNNLIFSGTLEFLNRKDGIIGLTNVYNLKFKQLVGIEDTPKYIAISSKETDIITAFSTDGLLKKFNLKTLKDDKNFFPPYYAFPLVRAEVKEKYPEVVELLEKLGPLLTEDVMIDLNYKVDEEQQEPDKVARNFLIENDLIK